jgi:hypothetical protein
VLGHVGAGLQVKLNSNRLFHLLDIGNREAAQATAQAQFADSGELVSHCFPGLPIEDYGSFAWKKLVCIAGERDDLDAAEMLIGKIIADDDGRALLANLAAHGGVEIDPPNFAPLHPCTIS